VFIELIFLGRGGQGVITSSRVFAEALLRSGFYVQSFPEFGPERSGAPVRAYLRVSGSPVSVRLPIERGDAAAVFDERLLDVFTPEKLVKKNGLLLVNSKREHREYVNRGFRVVSVDASGIADYVGKPKAVGIAIIGALARLLHLSSIDIIAETVRNTLGEKDAEAARIAYGGVEKVAEAH